MHQPVDIAVPDEPKEEPVEYRNHYHCERCDETWDDEWDCMCNDKCPKCNAEIEPYDSEEI